MGMRLEIDIPEHHYNNIMAFDSVSLGRVPYKGIIMYAINAIKHGRVLEQERTIQECQAESDKIDAAFHDGYNNGYAQARFDYEQEPTTKNDLGVDAISRADVLKLMQDNWHTHNGDWAMQESMDDIRALPSVTPQLSSGLEKNSKKLEKNFGELDCISRADAIKAMQEKAKRLTNEDTINGLCGAVAILFDLPPVTPQEPRIDFEELKRKILMEVDGGTDDKWLRYADVCDRISDSIDKYKAEVEPQESEK